MRERDKEREKERQTQRERERAKTLDNSHSVNCLFLKQCSESG